MPPRVQRADERVRLRLGIAHVDHEPGALQLGQVRIDVRDLDRLTARGRGALRAGRRTDRE